MQTVILRYGSLKFPTSNPHTSHIGHLITAVLANLTDQIKRSSSALVKQVVTESAERGDSNAAQFQLTVTLKRDYQKGNY